MMGPTDCSAWLHLGEMCIDAGIKLETLADAFEKVADAMLHALEYAYLDDGYAEFRKWFNRQSRITKYDLWAHQKQLYAKLRPVPLVHAVRPRKRYEERLCCVKHFV